MQVERTDVGDLILEVGFVIVIVVIKSFTDLDVYTRAQYLYPQVVRFSRDFSREGFHLRDQVCRSANSIHANIAEGFGRSCAEFKMYLTRSLGSCNETRSHIQDSINANFGDEIVAKNLLSEYEIVSKQLFRLRERWK
jgi:four helix bundle protein